MNEGFEIRRVWSTKRNYGSQTAAVSVSPREIGALPSYPLSALHFVPSVPVFGAPSTIRLVDFGRTTIFRPMKWT